jgi:hypothetical protein
MKEATEYGRELRDAPEAGEALFGFMQEIAGRQQLDRCLFEAVSDEFLANAEIRAAHAEIVGALEDLLERARDAGAVRGDVGAMDVLMLLKGVCQATSALAATEPGIVGRQLDLVRAAISPHPADTPLRGRPPMLADFERAAPQPDVSGAAAS